MFMRMIAVALLACLMTFPVNFIYELTQERYERYLGVIREISSVWGGQQTLAGPVIAVPYTVRRQITENIRLTDEELTAERAKGSSRVSREAVSTVESEHVALILPDELAIDGEVHTELRSRGIYSAQVYTADLAISGSFKKPDLSGLRPNIAEIHWDKAVFTVGLSGTKAIRKISDLEIADDTLKFLPGSGGLKALPTGFSSFLDMSAPNVPDDGMPLDFSFRISMGGSERLYFAPLGVVSRFALKSSWPHPNFTGSGLPVSRDITSSGFSALWEISNLVRNFPQVDDSEVWGIPADPNVPYSHLFEQPASEADGQKGHNMLEYVVGVEFFEPIFHYSLMDRATKFAVLFIALTFLGVVIFENYCGSKNKIRLSIAQYGIIGLGLSLFYLVLLAASEHMSFTAAYCLASAINIAMTGGYVLAALKLSKPAMALLAALAHGLLYALLFFILRMEDYALLAGTAVLLLGMIVLMAVTRNLNRPAENTEETPQQKSSQY
jgi:inner membrane protein